MPTTVASATFLTLALVVLLAVSLLAVRRLGTAEAPDPVIEGWRRLRRGRRDETRLLASADDEEERRGGLRGLFRRRSEETEQAEGTEEAEEAEEAVPDEPEVVPEALEPEEPEEPEEDEPAESAVEHEHPDLDHVPFEVGGGRDGDDGEAGGLGARLRLGLRKTRDYLNRDVREVFGPGPVPEAFEDLEEVLVRADVGVTAATSVSDELRERGRELTSDTLPEALKEEMRAFLGEADRRLRVNPGALSAWLVVGVNGTGKTTTIAKLARHATAQGFRVCLAASDTFRAAAIEQLVEWGDRVGVEVIRQHPGADPAAVAYDAVEHAKARGYDLVIVDTAGRLHTRRPLMEELSKVRRVLERHEGLVTECLLVLDATTGQNGIAQAKAFGEAVDVTGLVLAKLDGTAKGGIAFAVERELGVPVKAIGIGETAEDLAPFDPDAFVDAILG